jgi:hypothetical protein
LVIENLSFVIWADGSEDFAKNAQYSGIALHGQENGGGFASAATILTGVPL